MKFVFKIIIRATVYHVNKFTDFLLKFLEFGFQVDFDVESMSKSHTDHTLMAINVKSHKAPSVPTFRCSIILITAWIGPICIYSKQQVILE